LFRSSTPIIPLQSAFDDDLPLTDPDNDRYYEHDPAHLTDPDTRPLPTRAFAQPPPPAVVAATPTVHFARASGADTVSEIASGPWARRRAHAQPARRGVGSRASRAQPWLPEVGEEEEEEEEVGEEEEEEEEDAVGPAKRRGSAGDGAVQRWRTREANEELRTRHRRRGRGRGRARPAAGRATHSLRAGDSKHSKEAVTVLRKVPPTPHPPRRVDLFASVCLFQS
jgi:hypothetical protein